MAAGAADPIITASCPADPCPASPCSKGVGEVDNPLAELCGTARGPGTSAAISGLPKGPLRAVSAAKGEIGRGGSGTRRTGAVDVIGDVDCPAAGRNAAGPLAGPPTGNAPFSNCSNGS